MKKRNTLYAVASLAIGLTFLTGEATAQQIFENWNPAACGLTNRASFTLSKPTRLTAIELWYHWGAYESEVDYALLFQGELVKRGHLMRGSCDPYQQAWCTGRGNVGVDLPPGRVEVVTSRGKLCQNEGSGGIGFIRAFGIAK